MPLGSGGVRARFFNGNSNRNQKITHGVSTFIIYFCKYIFFKEWFWWNQKFGCLQHAGHTPVPLHNSQSAMALLHGYPLGLFDHPKWTSQVRDEQASVGADRTAQSGE